MAVFHKTISVNSPHGIYFEDVTDEVTSIINEARIQNEIGRAHV